MLDEPSTPTAAEHVQPLGPRSVSAPLVKNTTWAARSLEIVAVIVAGTGGIDSPGIPKVVGQLATGTLTV